MAGPVITSEFKTPIDYGLIAAALDWYRERGYLPIEVPWIVPPDSVLATLPVGSIATSVTGGHEGCLVGSAEQSFMHLMERGKLAPGKYVAVTPCFRHEDVHSDQTRPWFLKVELCHYFAPDEPRDVSHVLEMVDDAAEFLRRRDVRVGVYPTDASTDERDRGYDLIDDVLMLELGSYGARDWRGHRWVYGTGCAEPRTSIAWCAQRKAEDSGGV